MIRTNFNHIIASFGILFSLLFTQTSAAEESTIGEQKVLVVLANFQDNPTEQPFSVEQARVQVFTQVNNYYKEASFGQTWLTGDVVGYYTLPMSNTSCVPNYEIKDALLAIMQQEGVNVEAYDRFIVLHTKNACASEGSGGMGYPSWAYMNGQFDNTRVIAHELGHNFGLSHAGAYDCKDGVTFGNDCRVSEYGDTFDAMGNAGTGYFNTFEREQLGWLSGEHASKVKTVDASGEYTISAYEINNNQAVALKILRGVDATTGDRTYFYIEYRKAMGYDSYIGDWSYSIYRQDVTAGVIVRLGTENQSRSSQLLHMKPNSVFYQRYGMNDFRDPGLAFGTSFEDPVSGLVVKAVSGTDTSATVMVTMGNGEPSNPPTPEDPPSDDSNSAPIAADDAVEIASKSAVTIDALANDNDPDGDILTIKSVGKASLGSVTIKDNKIYYVPGKRFKDRDSFIYTITDGKVDSSATVTIQLVGSSDGGGGSGGGGKGRNK